MTRPAKLWTLILVVALTLPALADKAPSQPPSPLRTNQQRAVPLQGTGNTRDLGGLPARDGYVRDGLVFRSGALCFATEADLQQLAGLKLSTLLELRIDPEIRRDGPDRLKLKDAVKHNVRLPMASSRGRGAEAYANYLEENRQALRGFFELLGDPGMLPLLFHCSAGKDRTGILTALLLESLGTPRPLILDDYLQSVRNSAGLEVHPEWLEVVFRAVDRAGGIQTYLESKGVSRAVQQAAHRNLVRPVQR